MTTAKMLQDLDRAVAQAAEALDKALSTPLSPLVRKLVGWSLLATALTLMWNYEIEAAGLFAIAAVLALMWADQADRQLKAELHVRAQRDFGELDADFARRIERVVDDVVRNRLAEFVRRERAGGLPNRGSVL